MRQTGTWKTELKPENEWGNAECDPIVSEAVWNETNQLIEEQLEVMEKARQAPTYLFSGLAALLLQAPRCTCPGTGSSCKYVCRKCCNKVPIVDLENIVKGELKLFFGQRERVAEHLKNADRNLVEKSAALEAHQREIQKVQDEMTRTHRLYLDGGITSQGFGQFYKPAEERLNH